jgi:hypothetical protein
MKPRESGRSLMVIRRGGVLSLGKVLGVLYALLGLIVGALFAIVSLLGAAVGVANSQSSDAFAGLLFGVGSVIFLPIFYGILGFVFGLTGTLHLQWDSAPYRGHRDLGRGDQARELQQLFISVRMTIGLGKKATVDNSLTK